MKKLFSALVVIALLFTSGCQPAGQTAAPASQSGPLDLLFFDAGKADAILLTTEHSAVLVDCGLKGFGKTILDTLAEKGIDRLDLLIVTHFDKDHVGGAAKVLNSIPVAQVLQNDCPKDSSEVEKYEKALGNAGLEPVTVTETMTLTLDGVTYRVDPARTADFQEDESNNSSLVVTVTHGENVLLLPGDVQTQRIGELLESGVPQADLLKIPHHGKEEPLLDALVKGVDPAWAVITSSDEEPEDPSTTAVLEQRGVKTLLTRQGAVLVHSDGTSLTVTQEALALAA